ncbi:nicotinamide riboside transporter PnuC [Fructilactobacillus fructivorans]|uniref:Putative integral membrane protein n=1 Tax=Fructilactobacillus fructivorans TaxID=1614 RepID=A0A0C1PPD0_9LACO|nr:nicotinamide riboside transporter PnuC [Fructilactobacillus fructivorans]KID42647.1 putative integral membrane protein [Fructilactobacillus fructivorans]MCT0151873.1 nicotinamide mononucleotide transporter [Fructilactobacillus fructivorans]MCT2867998.1 nicotinamide mononucleotide transporter [Fructilactobacillus fructivorans]MCT2868650.1 nicotinamide mononucleotide transporter [Fructilactobacillus fructivorans]MCT2873419.1 nicotinamide mononucleotide transporter [Fructilactobacillus fructiv
MSGKNNIAAYDILKPSWYVNQMKGWSFTSYLLLLFGLGVIAGSTVTQPITFIAIMTMLAGMLGFTTTISITNTKPLNGIFGLVSALIYIYVAFTAKNYNDIILQTTYIVLLDIPVLLIPSWATNVDKHIKKLTIKGNLKKTLMNWGLTALFFVVVLGVLYAWEHGYSDSPRPFVDSFAATIGITGALLTTLRFRDTYYFWLAQGIFSIILWGITAYQGGANWTLFLTYILYLFNDLLSFFDKNIAWFHTKTVNS